MKVSIITATYNSERTIASSIESVLNQDYLSKEHIIVDGCSSDGTLKTVASYGSAIAKVISEPDSGIYDAMNKGIKVSSGDIIGILNSDDLFVDGRVLTDIVKVFSTTGVECVYADLVYVDSESAATIKRRWVAGNFKRSAFLWGWMPPHPTFFVKRELFSEFGFFDTRFSISADYELMLRFLFKHRVKVAYLPRVIVKMRLGGISNNSIRNRLIANREDTLAWTINSLQPFFFTRILKPLRKIVQYF